MLLVEHQSRCEELELECTNPGDSVICAFELLRFHFYDYENKYEK